MAKAKKISLPLLLSILFGVGCSAIKNKNITQETPVQNRNPISFISQGEILVSNEIMAHLNPCDTLIRSEASIISNEGIMYYKVSTLDFLNVCTLPKVSYGDQGAIDITLDVLHLHPYYRKTVLFWLNRQYLRGNDLFLYLIELSYDYTEHSDSFVHETEGSQYFNLAMQMIESIDDMYYLDYLNKVYARHYKKIYGENYDLKESTWAVLLKINQSSLKEAFDNDLVKLKPFGVK